MLYEQCVILSYVHISFLYLHIYRYLFHLPYCTVNIIPDWAWLLGLLHFPAAPPDPPPLLRCVTADWLICV